MRRPTPMRHSASPPGADAKGAGGAIEALSFLAAQPPPGRPRHALQAERMRRVVFLSGLPANDSEALSLRLSSVPDQEIGIAGRT